MMSLDDEQAASLIALPVADLCLVRLPAALVSSVLRFLPIP